MLWHHLELLLQKLGGRLLRKYSKKVIIAYDSDVAGQAATLRGLEILTNLGVDVRILQMEGAKDPDEFVIKYGNARFNKLVEDAISLIEFRVKMLKNELNIDNTNDKIKFLNAIAKLLSTVDNKIEQEIYIDKIAKEYNISKEAIYAETNKMNYSNNRGVKLLESNKAIKTIKKTENISLNIIKREQLIINLLISGENTTYKRIKDKIQSEDLKDEKNRKIVQKLYEEFEKGNSNINSVLDFFAEDEETVGILTKILADDYEIKNIDKAIEDILNVYEKEKLITRRDEIIAQTKENNIDSNIEAKLLKELQDINVKLTQLK